MELFGDTNYVKKQLSIFEDMIAARKERLEEIEGRDSPEIIQQRRQLEEEIRNCELQAAQVLEGAERAGHDAPNYEREHDVFDD